MLIRELYPMNQHANQNGDPSRTKFIREPYGKNTKLPMLNKMENLGMLYVHFKK